LILHAGKYGGNFFLFFYHLYPPFFLSFNFFVSFN
jgi:hypothetical protein